MIKKYFNISLLLFFSWAVYGYCQQDFFLPLSAAIIIIVTFISRLKPHQHEFAFFNSLPLSAMIIISFMAGLLWRNIFPAPEEATSPFPELTAALQAATIFAAVVLWLRPFRPKQMYQLAFTAWLTVAVSINVPFNSKMFFVFCSFCIVSIGIIILQTIQKPAEKRNLFRYYRDFTVYASLLVSLTVGFFYGISKMIVIFDEVFMHLASDYILPRNYTHFLRIDSRLNLTSPGTSAWDTYPVLELSIPDVSGVYLKIQTFRDYDNGVMKEVKDLPRIPLSSTLDPKLIPAELTLFSSFKDIIPTPIGVKAAQGLGTFSKNRDEIIYSESDQRTRILRFSLDPISPSINLTEEEFRQYTAIPSGIADQLKAFSSSIVQDGALPPSEKADLIRDYFYNNFGYTLNVKFNADNNGLIEMIRNKRAAYCSYFATATMMLLRAEGIPARVATGFSTGEKIDMRRNRFLARISNAHAWTEALLPEINEMTGKTQMTWQIIDATPPGLADAGITPSNIFWNRVKEKMILSMLRLGAELENIDREKMRRNFLIFLILIMSVINFRKIAKRFKSLLRKSIKTIPSKPAKPSADQRVYQRYENYLKNSFHESRFLPDTDKDVLTRLQNRKEIPKETVAKIESFIRHYHAARFGEQKDLNLEEIILSLEQDSKASAGKA